MIIYLMSLKIKVLNQELAPICRSLMDTVLPFDEQNEKQSIQMHWHSDDMPDDLNFEYFIQPQEDETKKQFVPNSDNKIINTMAINLIRYAHKLLNDEKLYCDYQGMIEFWRYNCETELINTFGKHIDDYGAVNYNVETCIIYLRKTVSGGGLLVWSIIGDNDFFLDFDVCENTVMLLPGNMIHKGTIMKGKGTRECIVIHLKSKRMGNKIN